MNKVMITMVTGNKMLWPVEHAKKVIRKNDLVKEVIFWQDTMKQEGIAEGMKYYCETQISKAISKIRTLNRQIPSVGETV